MLCGVSSALLQSMDVDKDVSNKNEDLKSYFLDYDCSKHKYTTSLNPCHAAAAWSYASQVTVKNINHEKLEFDSFENEAEKYSRVLSEYGQCTYAKVYKGNPGDFILAGFANGSVLMQMLYDPKMLTCWNDFPREVLPQYCAVTTVYELKLTTKEGHLQTAMLVGHQDRSLWLHRFNGATKEVFNVLDGNAGHDAPITFITYGEALGMYICAIGKGNCYQVLFLKTSPNGGIISQKRNISIQPDLHVTGFAPYAEYGFAVQAAEGCFAYMPDHSKTCTKILNGDFTEPQKKLIYRVTDLKCGDGGKVVIEESEKEHFAALPLVIQKILLNNV
jgi:hypothetical protein